MKWAFQDAKARLSEVVRRAEAEGPQEISVRGKPAVVVLSAAEFAALKKKKKRKSLAELYRNSPLAGEELDLTRSQDFGRDIEL